MAPVMVNLNFHHNISLQSSHDPSEIMLMMLKKPYVKSAVLLL